MKRLAKDYFIEDWETVFEYDETSPSFLRWKGRMDNSPAGWQCTDGRWKVEYMNKGIQVHRIIYFLNFKHLEKHLVVDHIDQNPSNNRINNLRLVGSNINSRNKKMGKNNKSGCTGVHEIHEWVASWLEDGKARCKAFKVSDFGDEAKSKAEQYRAKKIEELNSKQYEYSEIHGLRVTI